MGDSRQKRTVLWQGEEAKLWQGKGIFVVGIGNPVVAGIENWDVTRKGN